MKRLVIILLFFLSFLSQAFAGHINGGEVFYEYLGPGSASNTSRYELTLRLFRDETQPCGTGSLACLPTSAYISVFENAAPFRKILDILVNRTNANILTLTTYPACISSKPVVSYEAYSYVDQVVLADNDAGYIVIFQTCCRAFNNNVDNDPRTTSGAPGSTYEAIIPGNRILPGEKNSSAVFNLKDTVIACKESDFRLDFGATDPDGDILTYAFAAAFDGGSFNTAEPVPAAIVNYRSIRYLFPYSATQPLGANVLINSQTGTINGTAPPSGNYVVCVVCYEWRNGIIIAEHRKDFTFKVNNCSLPQVSLATSSLSSGGIKVNFINCNTNSIQLENLSPDPFGLINSFYWDFGVLGTDADTSIMETPVFAYPDTGIYQVTLIANKGQECTATATAAVAIYPGFTPDFRITGSCVETPYQFTDLSTAAHGNVNFWLWDFGETGIQSDFSMLANTTYTYPSTGNKTVKLIVASTKGCKDSVEVNLAVGPGPQLSVPFDNTVMCSVDTIRLNVNAVTPNPTYTWYPNYNILYANTDTPRVFPKLDTEYIIRVDDGACKDSLRIFIKVVDKVTTELLPDTSICERDQILLRNNTNAVNFIWTPDIDLDATDIAEPTATPLQDTKYLVRASVGSCFAIDSVIIKVVPYPLADAGYEATICYGKSLQLAGVTDGSSFVWEPKNTLIQFNTLTPVAGPLDTTKYYFYAYDTLGCAKPGIDSVIVNVVPKVIANAGFDTTVVIQQPLQFNASGGAHYTWSPGTYLSDPNIGNPIAVYPSGTQKISYQVTASTPEGCIGTDSITVFVFQTKPELFIPTAFSPNNDGLNDVFRPSLAGMKQLNYFSVYNRWGQLLFTTNKLNEGWDGVFKGTKQLAGTYVYMAEAVNYLGAVVRKRGTVQLIR